MLPEFFFMFSVIISRHFKDHIGHIGVLPLTVGSTYPEQASAKRVITILIDRFLH